MDNYILLNHITHKEVKIDLNILPVEEGFKGVYCLSKGLHYVSVGNEDGNIISFWCYFKGEEGVIAKSFNSMKQAFVEWDDKDASHYKKLALDEELDDEMIIYPKEGISLWSSLTYYIEELGRIPELNLVGNNVRHSFSKLFNDVHKGDIVSVMAEFQFAFVRMAVQPMGEKDEQAVERWKEMMEIFYSATQDEIEDNQQFFIEWVDFLFHQFETLPDRTFQRTGESTTYKVIVKNAASLCDKLMKCSDEDTVISGKRLRLYLTQRGAQL